MLQQFSGKWRNGLAWMSYQRPHMPDFNKPHRWRMRSLTTGQSVFWHWLERLSNTCLKSTWCNWLWWDFARAAMTRNLARVLAIRGRGPWKKLETVFGGTSMCISLCMKKQRELGKYKSMTFTPAISSITRPITMTQREKKPTVYQTREDRFTKKRTNPSGSSVDNKESCDQE